MQRTPHGLPEAIPNGCCCEHIGEPMPPIVHARKSSHRRRTVQHRRPCRRELQRAVQRSRNRKRNCRMP